MLGRVMADSLQSSSDAAHALIQRTGPRKSEPDANLLLTSRLHGKRISVGRHFSCVDVAAQRTHKPHHHKIVNGSFS